MACRKLNQWGLTPQEECFCLEYYKTGKGSESLKKAYPTSKNWKPDSIYAKASNLLDKDKIKLRIEALQAEHEKSVQTSKKLNHHKLLEAALEILEDTRHTPSQYANAINVLKLLYSQQGMMPSANSQQINIQVNNNTVVGEVTDYLDL